MNLCILHTCHWCITCYALITFFLIVVHTYIKIAFLLLVFLNYCPLLVLLTGFDDNERMSSQRTLLNKHLGLDFANGMGIDSPEFFKDEDLKLNFHQRTPLSSPTQSQVG